MRKHKFARLCEGQQVFLFLGVRRANKKAGTNACRSTENNTAWAANLLQADCIKLIAQWCCKCKCFFKKKTDRKQRLPVSP